VLPDADLDQAARDIVGAAWAGVEYATNVPAAKPAANARTAALLTFRPIFNRVLRGLTGRPPYSWLPTVLTPVHVPQGSHYARPTTNSMEDGSWLVGPKAC